MKSSDGDTWLTACAGAGDSLVAAKDFKGAMKVLEKGMAKAGDSPSPALLLAMGKAQAGLGRTADARSSLERVISAYSGTSEAESAQKALSAL